MEVPRHLCDPTRSRAAKRRTQGHPVPQGGFHKAGEGPAFGDSFPDFSSGRNRAQRSVPTRLASRNHGRLDDNPSVCFADSSPYTGEPLRVHCQPPAETLRQTIS